ncbi:MAG: amidohydrolase [Acidimicrobiales bacterium]|nr:amidohydrolase [Acidimicrobiales bacterium]
MAEKETAAEITRRLESFGYQTHQIGGGVVGLLDNGDGPTVLFRADIDALPVEEDTGLPYSSEVPGVMHACGHDFHITSGLGTAALLAENRDSWSGTYVALFQPGEETAEGARAMVDDGLVGKVPRPDVALSQHVLTKPAAGEVATASGPVLSTAASMKVVVYGKGSHGSMPHLGIDPVVLASAIVMRLQGIVSREIAPSEFGVVTVGSLQAGSKANIIPDRAELRPNRPGQDRPHRRRPQHPRIGAARCRHRSVGASAADHGTGASGVRHRLHHAVDHGPAQGLLGRSGTPAGRVHVSIGSWGGSGLAAVFGGGVVIALGWRWIFVISIAVSALAFVLIVGTPENKPAAGQEGRFDYLGLVLFVVAHAVSDGDPHLRPDPRMGEPDGHRPGGCGSRVVLLLHSLGAAAVQPIHRSEPVPEHDLHRSHDLQLPSQLHHRDPHRQPAAAAARRPEGRRERLQRVGRGCAHHRLRRFHHRVHPGRREAAAAVGAPQADDLAARRPWSRSGST